MRAAEASYLRISGKVFQTDGAIILLAGVYSTSDGAVLP
jgi:hypothetical protein